MSQAESTPCVHFFLSLAARKLSHPGCAHISEDKGRNKAVFVEHRCERLPRRFARETKG